MFWNLIYIPWVPDTVKKQKRKKKKKEEEERVEENIIWKDLYTFRDKKSFGKGTDNVLETW